MKSVLVGLTCGVAALAATAAEVRARTQMLDLRPALQHLLETDAGFSPAEILSLKTDNVVARVIASTDPREVAVAGAAHLDVSADYYVSRISNVGVPSPGSSPVDAGRFGTPASAADLAGWALAPADLKALDLCDVRGCAVRLTDDVIDRLRREAGPKAALAGDAWSRGAREAIAGDVAAFQSTGLAGLASFRNGTTSIAPSKDLPALRTRFGFLADAFPGLVEFLDRYPVGRAGQTEHFYWSLDTVMSTPVLTAMHLVVWPGASPLADRLLVTEQVYSSRDPDALMEVTLVAADKGPNEPGMTAVSITRSVSSSLLGLTGGAKRPIARSKARDALAEYLTSVRTAFERDFKK